MPQSEMRSLCVELFKRPKGRSFAQNESLWIADALHCRSVMTHRPQTQSSHMLLCAWQSLPWTTRFAEPSVCSDLREVVPQLHRLACGWHCFVPEQPLTALPAVLHSIGSRMPCAVCKHSAAPQPQAELAKCVHLFLCFNRMLPAQSNAALFRYPSVI